MNFLTYLKEKKKDFFKKENFYYLVILLLIFFFDRISKSIIISNYNENIYYLNDYVNFNLIWNIGIGFGLLSSDSPLFYNIVTILIGLVILFLVYIFILSTNVDKLIYSIIIGGALGNFYDRLIYKAVPDFIDLHYENFHWFTFNLADIFITLGVVTFIMKGFFEKN
tara:strand:+ start:245 stop:745 length:501 start_codon:yes stop_codon:yes gene_type:complete